MTDIVTLTNLTKTYNGIPALRDVTMSIPSGKIVGLLGPNGSGKTTLIKILNGLLQPTSGLVTINGFHPSPITKAQVAYLPDITYLDESKTIQYYLDFFQDFYADFRYPLALQLLEDLKLQPDLRLKDLSKGNKEKVQLILVMSREAKLYLLDEPIGGVDPASRDYILKTIINQYSEDASVIISTHLIADIESVLDEVVFLKYGQIELQGDTDNIRQAHGKSIDKLFRRDVPQLGGMSMFWKLVKYELQSVRKWYLGIYGIAILLSIPLGLMLQKLTVTFEHIHKEPSLLFMAFFTLIVIATIVVWGTIYIATIVLIIKRFATSVFGREGYLTNTLPVSAHQLILSKLLAAFILDTISSLVVLASIGIIAAFNLDIKDILLTTSYFGQILKEMGALYLFIPSIILGKISGILFYYLCISIGNLFNTNKVRMGFVAYFTIQAILFFIGFFFGIGAALTGNATNTVINNSSYIFSLVQSLVLIAASYFGTYYIMTKHLNLD